MKRRMIPMALVAGLVVQAQTNTTPALPASVTQGWLKHASEPASHDFKLRSQERDSKGQTVHRYDHYFKGLRILKSEGIVHADDKGNTHNSAYAYCQLLEPS